MTTPSQMPESLKVVAWRKHLSGAEWKLADYVLPDSEELVRLADAEAALKDRGAEIERLKKDAERLDWLDSLNQRLNAHYQTTYQWKLVLSPNVVRLMSGRYDIDLHDSDAKGVASCRSAIDAAIDSMKGGANG